MADELLGTITQHKKRYSSVCYSASQYLAIQSVTTGTAGTGGEQPVCINIFIRYFFHCYVALGLSLFFVLSPFLYFYVL